ncbi:MAG: hypothetical protein ACR2O2_07685 [Ruegeria sp.]
MKRVQTWARLIVLVPVFASMAGMVRSDEFDLKVRDEVSVKGNSLPYTLYISLDAQTQTQLGIDAFMDLRAVQRYVPALASNVLDETCKHKYALAVSDARAEGNAIVATGQFQAKFFACDTNDPEKHYRGVLLFGQNVNVVAKAAADVKENCVHLRLVDVELDLVGFVGTVSDLVGLTDKARELILEKGGEALAKNPICPELPDELAGLDPKFTSGGTREVGDGGVAAALSGSIDTSAATLLDLIRLMQDKTDFGVRK